MVKAKLAILGYTIYKLSKRNDNSNPQNQNQNQNNQQPHPPRDPYYDPRNQQGYYYPPPRQQQCYYDPPPPQWDQRGYEYALQREQRCLESAPQARQQSLKQQQQQQSYEYAPRGEKNGAAYDDMPPRYQEPEKKKYRNLS
ncbi:hypothetical protein K432DRAFT_386893 [Lepidopterella palustris CBS 459.81]|uniref:Uncharacterized protein n=1 Tax=Lepidopterella palustris CBS 459.81 TaxID=1314670 RepID=A0A8E2DYW3_9PEZI|nr:hypothetical protein K432DRAFT_386893 [Lepidopterella palustris CBS 459.81]